MKILAIIVNIFLPGIGTLIVRKFLQAFIQIFLLLVGWGLIATGVGALLGVPICFVVWIWAIISAVTAKEPLK